MNARGDGGPRDGYLRLHLSADPPTVVQSDQPLGADALMFVDVDSDQEPTVEDLVAAFQTVPHRLAPSEHVLIRWPRVARRGEATPEALRELLAALLQRERALPDRGARVGLVQFAVGGHPLVCWSRDDDDADDSVLLARARSTELHTLLKRGDGIWQPDTYHYRLPSGLHDRAFIRLADAIRSPRDAMALATWITPRMTDHQGILVDSASLTPLVIAIQSLAREAGLQPGPIASLDDYPRTALEVRRAASTAAAGAGTVLALLSVSSSGSMAAVLQSALHSVTVDDGWWLDVLVDKQARGDVRYPYDGMDAHGRPRHCSVWLGLKDMNLESASAHDCRACRDHTSARIVQIDPRSFVAMALSEPELIMPSTAAAVANQRFWTLVDQAAALGVEVPPAEEARPARPKESVLSVRVLLDRLIADRRTATEVASRLRTLSKQRTTTNTTVANRLQAMEHPDAFVATEDDARLLDTNPDVLTAIRVHLKAESAEVVRFNPHAREPVDELRHMHRVVVLSVGSVSGWTLRQFPQAFSDGVRELHALVVHARPATPREWASLRNVYSQRIVALWLTYLPWESPLRDESEIIAPLLQLAEELPPAVRAFLQQRQLFCSPPDNLLDWESRVRAFGELDGSDPRRAGSWAELANHSSGVIERVAPVPYAALLWGQPPFGSGRNNIRGESLYGRHLGPLATYAAVGAAVHEARMVTRAKAAPQWQMFELPAVVRSYFDGPLVATMLRWMRPQEVWWGGTPDEARRTVTELVTRFADDPADLQVLLPELFLAAAQGKLTEPALRELNLLAERYSESWDANVRIPLDAARVLVENAHIERDTTRATSMQ